jgi:hypothetical protein
MTDSSNPYSGQQIALATLHGKERAISPFFRRYLGASIIPCSVDTDSLGTFSGEREREGSPLEVCVRKARMGMLELGVKYGVATEGSFGPHPSIPFVSSHHEVVTFVDDERGMVVNEQGIFTRLVYGTLETSSHAEIESFLRQHRLGKYGVLVSTTTCSPARIIKGLRSELEVQAAVRVVQGDHPHTSIRLSTDMRAHQNPLRMWRIRSLAKRLVLRLATQCPACSAPGYGFLRYEFGLPCEVCGEATQAVRCEVYGCSLCGRREEKSRKDGKRWASSGECQGCNP